MSLVTTSLGRTGGVRCLEIGCLYGYACSFLLETLDEDAAYVGVDHDPQMARHTREAARVLGAEARVAVVERDFEQWLITNEETFDLVFFDCDRTRLDANYAALTASVRIDGLLAMDNALARGKLFDPEQEWQSQTARFNRRIALDGRFITTTVAVRDGVLLARRR